MAIQSTACILLLEIQQLWLACVLLDIFAQRLTNYSEIHLLETLPVRRSQQRIIDTQMKVLFLETFAIQKMGTHVMATQHAKMEFVYLLINGVILAIQHMIVIQDTIAPQKKEADNV